MPAPPVVRVIAGRTRRTYLRDLWRYRDLLYTLAWRDVKVRYKQTFIGGLWALLRPLLTLLIFTFVFGRVAGLAASTPMPYALLVLGGVLPWQLMSQIIAQGGDSLVGNERLISKVYFPRLLIPAGVVGVCLLDFLIALSLLLAAFLYYQWVPSWGLLLLPLWLVPVLLFSLGLGLAAAALNVRYRDVRYALPFALQLGLFISPVGFSTAAIPAQWQWLYLCNPAVGLIESFRWAMFGEAYGPFPIWSFAVAVVVSIGCFILGFQYFRATERTFADHI